MQKRDIIKRKTLVGICLCLALILPTSVMAKDKSVTVNVAISNTPITVNGQLIDLSHSQYPLLSYRNVVYFPLTYYGASLLGVQSGWYHDDRMDNKDHPFFFIGRGNRVETDIPDLNQAYPAKKANPKRVSAKVPNEEISVNTPVDSRQNRNETYPLLSFRSIVYFPLNWDYAVHQFGWSLSSDSKGNLIVDSTDPIRPAIDAKLAFTSGRFNPYVRFVDYVYNDTGYVEFPNSTMLTRWDYKFVYKTKGQPEKHFDLGTQLIPEGFGGYYEFNHGLDEDGNLKPNAPGYLPVVVPPSLKDGILTIRCVKCDEKNPWTDVILTIDCAAGKVISEEPCQVSEELPFPPEDPAHPYGLSNQSMKFLKSHGVDINIFSQIKRPSIRRDLDDDIYSLEMQTAANGFTDDQIQKFVQGMVNEPIGQ